MCVYQWSLHTETFFYMAQNIKSNTEDTANLELNYPYLANLEWGILKVFKGLRTLPVQRGWLAIQIGRSAPFGGDRTYSSFYTSKYL